MNMSEYGNGKEKKMNTFFFIEDELVSIKSRDFVKNIDIDWALFFNNNNSKK
jgi:hypothetical protein